MVCWTNAAGERKQPSMSSSGSCARGCAFNVNSAKVYRGGATLKGCLRISGGKASALVRTLCLLVRFPRRSVYLPPGSCPAKKAVVPNLVARPEVWVVHHVVVADALACAWGRQRGHPVEVAAFFNREVPSLEPCLGQRGILLFELYSLHLLNLKGPSF